MLAGSATASTAAVVTGAKLFTAMVGSGGIVAGGKMILDNVSQAINNNSQVFWAGGDAAKNAAQQVANNIDVAGKTLDMTRVGQYLEQINATREVWQIASANFANVANSSGSMIYSIQNIQGVYLQSIWVTTEYPLMSSAHIIYGVVAQDGSIIIMP